jgi:hypothetical protein
MRLPEVRAAILRLRGGQHYWQEIAELVEGMTDRQREALYRIIENAEDKGRQRATRDVRRQPWKYMGR